jgi:hypothetical protein
MPLYGTDCKKMLQAIWQARQDHRPQANPSAKRTRKGIDWSWALHLE